MPTKSSNRPRLENGDRLTREEFHRRYCRRPDIKKAELIEGVVYVASPVGFDTHGEPQFAIVGWLFHYRARHPEVRGGDNATVLLDDSNEVQPDACLWHEAPGGPRLTADHYVEGPPQLVVEVAASSARRDLGPRREAYRRNGIQEYILWRVLEQDLAWFGLENGEYVRLEPDADGVIESIEFPGLRLNVAKLLAGDPAGLLEDLNSTGTNAVS